MTAEEKILFVLDLIRDSKHPTPTSKLPQIDAREIDKILTRQDHEQIFEKFAKDYKILKIHTQPDYQVEFHYRFEILSEFEDFRKGYIQKHRKSKYLAGQYFGFNDKTFFITVTSNKPATINFNPRKGEEIDTYYLMRAFVDELERHGKWEDGYARVVAKQSDLKAYIKNNWPNFDMDRKNWFRDTKGNLVKKIPEDYINQRLITMDYFDRKLGGYPVSVKLPI